MISWINLGHREWPIDYDKVESTMRATYVADLCLRQLETWTVRPYSIFYQEKPPKPEYSNYFGLYTRNGSMFIVDGRTAAEGYWNGLRTSSGEIIFSRYRHDYRESTDRTCMVDGGRDYFKCSGTGTPVRLVLRGPHFIVQEADPED